MERALAMRRSERAIAADALTLQHLFQLLWSGQGVTRAGEEPARSLRTTPSAGATYPLELYAVVGSVEGLDAGVYRHVPARHALARISRGDPRTAARYGERAERYVHIEVGAASENIYLQAESLGLPADQDVLGIMPVGHVAPG